MTCNECLHTYGESEACDKCIDIDENKMLAVAHKRIRFLEARLKDLNADMLEALEEISDSATSINGPFTQYNVDDIQSPPMALARTIARAAIAKAKGEV